MADEVEQLSLAKRGAARRAGTFIRRLVAFVLVLSAVKIAWFLFAYSTPGSASYKEDVLRRRDYLVQALTVDYSTPQNLHPYVPDRYAGEWAIVSLSMTSLALADLAFRDPGARQDSVLKIRGMLGSALRSESAAFDTAAWGGERALEKLDSLSGHAGYVCHVNLMLGALRILGDESRKELHDKIGNALERAYSRAKHGLIETYPEQIWLPDNTACMASVAIWHKATGSSCAVCESWIRRVKESYLDQEAGVMVFNADPIGRVITGARGSGAAWNCYYLRFIDVDFAKSQYEAVKAAFGEELPFGLRAIRESLANADLFWGDIDSGPVLFGLSPSATGFAIGPAVYFEDRAMADGLLATAELAGFSVSTGQGRRYLTAPLVGDAILLAMRTAAVWDGRFADDRRKF